MKRQIEKRRKIQIARGREKGERVREKGFETKTIEEGKREKTKVYREENK